MAQRFQLAGVQDVDDGQHRVVGAVEQFLQPAQVLLELLRDWLAGEVPDYRAQLGVGVERQAVIDAPYALVDAEQRVASLAIGVVGQQVEETDAGELLRVTLAEREVVSRGLCST